MIKKIRALFYSSVLVSWFISSSWLFLLFCTIFYGIDYLTAQRKILYHLYFHWELCIPYIHFMFYIYFSVLFLPFVVPLIVSTPYKIRLWTEQMSAAIIISVCFFLLFPATLGYSETKPSTFLSPEIINIITGTYNLFPSLHVALSLITIKIIWLELKIAGKFFIAIWALLMTISTILTHQHHILDVVGSLFVFWATISIFHCKDK